MPNPWDLWWPGDFPTWLYEWPPQVPEYPTYDFRWPPPTEGAGGTPVAWALFAERFMVLWFALALHRESLGLEPGWPSIDLRDPSTAVAFIANLAIMSFLLLWDTHTDQMALAFNVPGGSGTGGDNSHRCEATVFGEVDNSGWAGYGGPGASVCYSGTPSGYSIARGFVSFDTAGSVPEGATITAVTPFFYLASIMLNDGARHETVALVQGFHASDGSLSSSDWGSHGTTRLCDDDIDSTVSAGVYHGMPLNAAGLATFNNAAPTKFALLVAMDLEGRSPTGGHYWDTQITVSFAGDVDPESGMAIEHPPYLIVEYNTGEGTPTESVMVLPIPVPADPLPPFEFTDITDQSVSDGLSWEDAIEGIVYPHVQGL